MKDPAHLADELVHIAFSPYFDSRLPPHLGSEVFKTNRRRLSLEGFLDEEHSQETFSRGLTKGLTYLQKHGGSSVRNPRSWFHRICRNEATRYLVEMAMHDSGEVLELLEGQTDLDDHIYDPQKVDQLLREAIQQLPPRQRELLTFDLVKCLPPVEIEKAMGIRSHDYFLVLKSEAFSALKVAVRALIEKGIGSLL